MEKYTEYHSDAAEVFAATDKGEWQQVSGSDHSGHIAPAEEAQLIEFMDDEATDHAFYIALAKKLADKNDAATISRIARDESIHLRRLRAAYFLKTGKQYSPNPKQPYINSTLDALRKAYGEEIGGVEGYLSAASKAKDAHLSSLYSELASDELRHSQLIIELLEKRF